MDKYSVYLHDTELETFYEGGSIVSTSKDDYWGKGGYYGQVGKGGAPAIITNSCYNTHKPLVIKGHEVYGGSCGTPVVKDAEVYIGLDAYSAARHPSMSPTSEAKGYIYPITDMSVPSDVADFKKLIDWLSTQIDSGKKVHIGCIGGHGRTGLLLSALVKVMEDKEDAIKYVREHYCKKAVESKAQVDWLVKHFGIKSAKVTKGSSSYYSGYSAGRSKSASGALSYKALKSAKTLIWTGV